MNPSLPLRPFLAAWMLAASAAFAGPLDNPGFETGDLSGWTTFGLGWRIGSGADAAAGAHGAVCDVLHEQEGESFRGIVQSVPVAAGRTYSASVDIRTVGIHVSKAWLELQWLDEAGGVLDQLQSFWITIDQPFTAAALSRVTAPPGAVAAGIRGIVFAEHRPDEGRPEFHIFDNFRFERH